MLIDGKKIAKDIQEEIKLAIHQQQSLFHRSPCLAVLLVGEHPASQIYVKRKSQACEAVGIRSIQKKLPATISSIELCAEIEKLNSDEEIDGILIQLPLPSQINSAHIIHTIRPDKDVDGFHPYNIGKMLIGEKNGFIPCTPLGIKVLLARSKIETSGRHVVILGRSNIVGKPMAALLMQGLPGSNATVTIAHRHSYNLSYLCQAADILIVAVGQPKMVTEGMVKEGATVIDVGINKIVDLSQKEGYQIVGDVDFAHVASKCANITPVPGGVGPMTIAMLLHNTLLSYCLRFNYSFLPLRYT
jgi:methylenetetrahydrofolate dehydrogenase (NADP+)/methenyltetrahydrofolate cyclohydrolase